MTPPYDAVLLIAFGGPGSPEEIRPFLARITKGTPIPPTRLEEVVHHYEAVGGKSPLKELTFRQAAALRSLLAQQGLEMPVYTGMRNSRPFFIETLKQMHADGITRAVGFILSSHRTEASWERYQNDIAQARAEFGERAPEIVYCAPWFNHPLFIQTWVELIGRELARGAAHENQAIPLVFTAHSLPLSMAARSPYVEQLQTSARLIVKSLDHPNWSMAYQSRSGKPGDPWLEPDIADVIREQAARGTKRLLVAPIGFVCEHVEVLYDLDIAAQKIAQESGIELIRASCPNDHPTFIRLIADVVTTRMAQS
jgi:ferrochelatase